MLSENIKNLRRAKGLSQEELAVKLHVVRQTVSKWEQGLSVPDADLLLSLSEVLETPVSTLLGETLTMPKADDITAISEKLEVINLQLARRKTARRRLLCGFLLAVCVIVAVLSAVFIVMDGSYLAWDYQDPETAVLGTLVHGAEWLFVRAAPVVLAGAAVGIFLLRKGE
ncbi:MAG: helix-turn-helix transcriptional regulator [Evtepia sp.]|uniref:helix-turn-helix domain-containing protein n=1 Tax=Evtepia sp. TaxID=2773933 RepID=UPI002A74FD14|nr:helix-turn-helix transcriptional regulator [Evtepia sp.]MDY3014113.1 helix-turn-helix transcriptional regulator [Evtepia sp.]